MIQPARGVKLTCARGYLTERVPWLTGGRPPLECRLVIGFRVLGQMFAFAVILVGLSIGLTPRSLEFSNGASGFASTVTCGSPLVPTGSDPACFAELNSRRILAVATLAVGGVALVVLPLAARRRS